MKYNVCSSCEKPFKKKFAKLEADVFKALGRKPSKLKHKDDGTQTYVACNPTLRLGEAGDESVVDNMMAMLAESLAMEIAASSPSRISSMEVMPRTSPRSCGWAGW